MIALAGFFLDNITIVIGTMLLSPLLGPINAFAVNANLFLGALVLTLVYLLVFNSGAA